MEIDEASLVFGTGEPVGGGHEREAAVDAHESVVESPKQLVLEKVRPACRWKRRPSISWYWHARVAGTDARKHNSLTIRPLHGRVDAGRNAPPSRHVVRITGVHLALDVIVAPVQVLAAPGRETRRLSV